MKITLIGYGRMGHLIADIAHKRGHEIVLTIDRGQEERFDDERFRQCDVVIEFSTPDSAEANLAHCFRLHRPVVCGTTGAWTSNLMTWRTRCEQEGQTLFWASNFSLGMNIFFALNEHLARMMNAYPAYQPSMTEIHHVHKLDAPSGTAVTLANDLIAANDRLTHWQLANDADRLDADALPIEAVRTGEVPGTHTITYQSEGDRLVITHEAFGREGFALGAVLAAEYTQHHSGFLTMKEMMNTK